MILACRRESQKGDAVADVDCVDVVENLSCYSLIVGGNDADWNGE